MTPSRCTPGARLPVPERGTRRHELNGPGHPPDARIFAWTTRLTKVTSTHCRMVRVWSRAPSAEARIVRCFHIHLRSLRASEWRTEPGFADRHRLRGILKAGGGAASLVGDGVGRLATVFISRLCTTATAPGVANHLGFLAL
jgi:hypothetical protein